MPRVDEVRVPSHDRRESEAGGRVGAVPGGRQRQQDDGASLVTAGEAVAHTQLLISNSLDMIISVDSQRRLVEFNPAAEACFGYAKEEVVGKSPGLLYADPDESERVQRAVLRDGTFTGEVASRRRCGERFDCYLSASVLRDGGGEVVGVMGVSRDITGQKRAERDMRTQFALQRLRNQILQMKSEQDWELVATQFHRELRAFVDYTRWSINVVDRRTATAVLYFHNEAGELMRRTLEHVPRAIQQALDTRRRVYRRNPEEMRAFGDNPWFERRGFQSILDVPFSSGTVATSSLRRDAFDDDDIATLERFAQVVSEAHRRVEDLKALAYTEQQLRQAQKLETIGRLGAGVAHEINNPLTVIMGQSELLLREELSEQQRRSVQHINGAAVRATTIAERLLLFARRQKTDKQWMDLNGLVHETVEMMRYQFSVRNVTLTEKLEDGLPHVQIHAGQIQQVVLNLIQNGRDAILEWRGEGEIVVRTRRQRGHVVLEVQDDGPGIPKGDEQRVLEPFYTTKEPGAGTGLGLSVCHGIAQDHGGHLYARPRSGGACLVLRLPVAAAASGHRGGD